MAKPIMHVTGMDGEIDLLPDRVVISRPGLWNAMRFGFNSQREIPIGAISEVAFKKAGALTFGELEFVRSGRSTDERKKNSQSAVKFKKNKNQEFEMLKEKVFQMMEQLSRQKS
jgi:predicted amidophosphoribosyltransferase